MKRLILLNLILAVGCSSVRTIPLDEALVHAPPGAGWESGILVSGYVTADGVEYENRGYLWPGPGGGICFLPFDRLAQENDRVVEFPPGEIVTVLQKDTSYSSGSTGETLAEVGKVLAVISVAAFVVAFQILVNDWIWDHNDDCSGNGW